MAHWAGRSDPNGAAPRCEHLDAARPVSPRSETCEQCTATGLTPVALRICLTCGWVACSDGSPGQHAKGHYEETDHAVAGSADAGSTWRWWLGTERALAQPRPARRPSAPRRGPERPGSRAGRPLTAA
jgi:Zn-finger in ubiquitin-hydrolases and other protein